MTRSMRRIALALVLTLAIVVGGTVTGIFDVFDLINRVQVSETENAYGGTTLVKVAAEDKVISWTETYDAEFMPTIDDVKAYQYVESTDENNELEEMMMYYMTDRSVADVVAFYQDFYPNAVVTDLDSMMSITTNFQGYDFTISVLLDERTEVTMHVKWPEE